MSGIGELAGKQLGPLPVGAWAVIIGGGIAGGLAIARRNATPAAPAAPTGVTGAVGAIDGAANVVDIVTDTNDQWERRALRSLIARGVDAVLAQQALGNFLLGFELTAEQAAVIRQALELDGPPPDGAPPIQVVTIGSSPTPTPTNPTPTPAPAPSSPSTTKAIQPEQTEPAQLNGSLFDLSVVGAGFTNLSNDPATLGQGWAPNTLGGITAPAGGILQGGMWTGDQLVGGRFLMPDGSTVKVGTYAK